MTTLERKKSFRHRYVCCCLETELLSNYLHGHYVRILSLLAATATTAFERSRRATVPRRLLVRLELYFFRSRDVISALWSVQEETVKIHTFFACFVRIQDPPFVRFFKVFLYRNTENRYHYIISLWHHCTRQF